MPQVEYDPVTGQTFTIELGNEFPGGMVPGVPGGPASTYNPFAGENVESQIQKAILQGTYDSRFDFNHDMTINIADLMIYRASMAGQFVAPPAGQTPIPTTPTTPGTPGTPATPGSGGSGAGAAIGALALLAIAGLAFS